MVCHSQPEDGVADLVVELTGADVVTERAPFGLQCAEGFHECEGEGGAEDLDFVGVEEAAEEVAVHGLAAVGGSEDDVLRATGSESAALLPHAEGVAADHVSGRSPRPQPALAARELPAEEELQDARSRRHRINPAHHRREQRITAKVQYLVVRTNE